MKVPLLFFLAAALLTASPAAAGRLGTAALVGQTDDVRRYLDAGDDPNGKDERSQTPLTLATGSGQIEIMTMLIDHGADVNLGENDGTAPLMYAAMNNRLEAAKLLLARGAQLDAKTDKGWTAVTFAADYGSPELLKFLIEKGAAIDGTSKNGNSVGETPLFLAAQKGNLEIVRILLDKGAAVGGTGERGQVPLIGAAAWGHLDVVKHLLESGALVDDRNIEEGTALMAAKNPAIVKILLEHGADVNARDKEGWTPLLRSAFDGELPAVKLLLENGANTDSKGPSGWNPLHDREAFVHEGQNGHWTALMYAAKEGKTELGKLLLDHGADAAAVEDEGMTALQIAQLKGQDQIVALLKDWKGKPQAASASSQGAPARESDVDAPNYKSPEDPSKFALVVGIEKYAHLPEARFAENDAAAVKRHFLALGVPERNLVYLTGPEASRAGLAKIVEAWLPRRVKADSTVFVYYSGHGAPDVKTGMAYLVPVDGDAQFLEETAYPVARLYQRLSALKSQRVIVILDSCFSGAGGRSVLAQGIRPLVTKVDTGFAKLGNVVVLAAAGAEEVTGVEEAQGHGLFTYQLLKGLNAKAGPVTLQSLFDYASPKVSDGARRQNRDQTLVFEGNSETKNCNLR